MDGLDLAQEAWRQSNGNLWTASRKAGYFLKGLDNLIMGALIDPIIESHLNFHP